LYFDKPRVTKVRADNLKGKPIQLTCSLKRNWWAA
jgi:hypothetical protein